MLSKKQMQQLSALAGTLATAAASGCLAMLYLTDWKCVCRYIPYYNRDSKFKD